MTDFKLELAEKSRMKSWMGGGGNVDVDELVKKLRLLLGLDENENGKS